MTAPTWTILVPTVAPRAGKFERLLGILLPQLDEFAGRVRVMAYLNHGEPSLGEIRDAMLAAADTDYVSFIDDDDTVVVNFVALVMDQLDQVRPDHVGFRLEFIVNGTHEQFVEHSLRYRKWGRTGKTLFRDFNHIDPIRTELARKASFAVPAGRAEDRVWVKALRPHLDMASEAYIDAVIYHYRYAPAESMWTRSADEIASGERPAIEHPCLSWHPDSD